MVKKTVKFLAYMLFFTFALMAFMPKEGFYYLLEELLQKEGVVISGERVDTSVVALHIEGLDVSFKGIESAHITDADVMLLGIYNAFDFKDVKLSSLVESYLPSDVANMTLHYSLLSPLELLFEAEGDFGSASGSFEFTKRSLELKLTPSTLMQMQYAKSLKMFKKADDGGYVYAKTF